MVVTDGCNSIYLYVTNNAIESDKYRVIMYKSRIKQSAHIYWKKNHNDTVNKYKILYVENMGKCNGPQWDKNMKINVSNISLRYPFSVMYLTLSRIFKKINSVLKTLIWTPLCLPKSSNEWIWAQHFVMVMKYIFKRGMLCSVCQWFAKKSDSVSN